jgi:hypothetical protein
MSLNQPYWSTIVDLEEFLNPRRVKYFRWENPDRTIITQRGASVPDSFLYPSIKCNKVFLFELTEAKQAKDLFSPIEFYNLLYNCLEIVLANLDKRKDLSTWQWIKDREPDRNRYQYLVKSLFYLVCELNRTPWMLPGNLTNEALAAESVSEKLEDITMDLEHEIERLERDQAESVSEKLEDITMDLEHEIERLQRHQDESRMDPGPISQKFTVRMLALKHVYDGPEISNGSNAEQFAKAHGWAGGSLYNKYRIYLNVQSRVTAGRIDAYHNLVSDFENLIISGILSDESKQKAIRELAQLMENRKKLNKI